MADGTPCPHCQRKAHIGVQDALLLQIATLIDPNHLVIAAQRAAKPDRRSALDHHFTDNIGIRRYPTVACDVGAVPVYNQAPNYLAPGGKVVMVGMPHIGDAATYDPGTMASIGQGMVGSKMGDAVIARDIPWMVDLYQQGRLKLDELVSQTWSLDQINDAIADTKTGSAKRNVIVFD